jgi:hypothetical protein
MNVSAIKSALGSYRNARQALDASLSFHIREGFDEPQPLISRSQSALRTQLGKPNLKGISQPNVLANLSERSRKASSRGQQFGCCSSPIGRCLYSLCCRLYGLSIFFRVMFALCTLRCSAQTLEIKCDYSSSVTITWQYSFVEFS